jgi:aminoglycoside phosphotransferase (APT) family kinase protein
MSNDISRLLQGHLRRAVPGWQRVQVEDLTDLGAGWESELYSFTVEHGPAGNGLREGLVLRVYPGDDADAKSAHEFRSMSQLRQAGYPVPRVILLERENSPFGSPFVIMERIQGQMLGSLLFGAPEAQQQELLTLFCELFVRLHRLDWRHFVDGVTGDEIEGPYFLVDRWLSRARDGLARFGQVGLLPIVEWLERRREALPCERPSPVHQDFHPENVLLRADGSPVVIDWTAFDVSDSRLDLAWTLVLAHSYLGAEWRNRILQEYERVVGARVEQIELFEVFACGRRLFDISVSLAEGPETLGMRPGAVAMMKQQMGAAERVYELLVDRTGIRIAELERMFGDGE